MLHPRRQGPGISSEIETGSSFPFSVSSLSVARGLASHLRLKLSLAFRERQAKRRRQGPGISSEIETTFKS